MSIEEGKLRAYLDQALSAEELAKVKKELADSPEAQAALARLSQERHDFASYLTALTPPSGEQPDAAQAWRRFQRQISGQSNPTQTTAMKERIGNMLNQSFIKRYQPAFVLLTVVAIIAIALSFAPVRAVAGNLLKIFRVQTVKVVPVDKEDVEALRNNPNLEKLVDQFEPQLKVITDSEPQKVDSVDEAADLVNFDVAEITALPAEAGDPTITVYQQKVVHLQLDKELLEAVFEAAEIEVDLSDSIDAEPIIVTQPDTVVQKWHHEGEEIVSFTQMTAPAIEYPDGLDLNALGVAGLQLLGISKEEATTLGQTIDWANTIILPVPRDSEMTTTEISIKGTTGLLFAHPDPEDGGSAVTWTQNGKSYFINTDQPPDTVIEMAESVQ